MITRRKIVMALGAGALTTAMAPGIAQTTGSPRRIAILHGASVEAVGHFIDAFRAALKSLGYSEGRDIVIDIRWAENKLERLPALIQDLLSYKPSIIVTSGTPGVVACQQATSTVPIVFAAAGDPVGQGFIKSYRQPGGNITGVCV
jgi:putative ABC transport system substrate-binding protein